MGPTEYIFIRLGFIGQVSSGRAPERTQNHKTHNAEFSCERVTRDEIAGMGDCRIIPGVWDAVRIGEGNEARSKRIPKPLVLGK